MSSRMTLVPVSIRMLSPSSASVAGRLVVFSESVVSLILTFTPADYTAMAMAMTTVLRHSLRLGQISCAEIVLLCGKLASTIMKPS